MKAYALFYIETGKQMGSRIWKSEQMAIKEMELSNSQFERYNEIVKKNYPDKKTVSLVEVREINFNKRGNLDL